MIYINMAQSTPKRVHQKTVESKKGDAASFLSINAAKFNAVNSPANAVKKSKKRAPKERGCPKSPVILDSRESSANPHNEVEANSHQSPRDRLCRSSSLTSVRDGTSTVPALGDGHGNQATSLDSLPARANSEAPPTLIPLANVDGENAIPASNQTGDVEEDDPTVQFINERIESWKFPVAETTW
jgi:hypothetical protein